jgi:uncharacterized protein (TIGR03435 family)
MKLPIWLLLTAAAFGGAASAQTAGDLPPALSWDKLKGNCPASLDWSSLRGKVVAISIEQLFPSQIAEWKQMAEGFSDQSTVFLFVFSGSEFLLDQALEQSSYTGCVLLDEKMVNRQNFAIPRYIDNTVVVDGRGFLAGFELSGSYDRVQTAVQALLDNTPVSGLRDSPRTVVAPSPNTATDVPSPSYAVQIARAEKYERRALGMDLSESGKYISRNQPLKNIIFDLWETSPSRISFPENLDDTRYDVIANMPSNDEGLVRTLVQEAVERYFGLHIEKETRSMRSYLLTVAEPSPHLQPAKEDEVGSFSNGQGVNTGTAAEMKDIAFILEDILGVPVIDQTGLAGKYDYFASSKLEGPAFALEMAQQLGLELKEAEQPVEMLVVEKFW